MAVSIGLDVGVQSVKIAVIEGSAKKPRLRAFIDHRLEPGHTTRALGQDGLAALLQRLFLEKKVPRGGTIVAAAAAASCLTRELTVPFAREEQIAKTIKFQAESVFPSISIDDMVVEYYKLDDLRLPVPTGEKKAGKEAVKHERSRLLVIALKKEALRQQLATLQLAEIDPAMVDLDVGAIYNAWSLGAGAAAAERTLIVDLGSGSMKMLAIEGGRLRALRSLRAQAAGIKVGEKKRPTPTLEDLKDGLSPDEREDAFFMEDEGRLPVVILDEEQSEVFDLASESEETRQNVLEKILLEIDRTLATTRLEGPIEKVLLTGGGAAADGIEKAFADHFQAPCGRLELARALGAPVKGGARGQESLDLVGATAVGLALKGIGYDKSGIDFRKEEFTFAGKFEKAKRGVACSLVLLFVFFFILAYNYRVVEMDRLWRKQDSLLKFQRRIWFTLFPDDQKPPPDVLEALKKKEKELKGIGADQPDILSALDMLRDTAQGFDESGKKLVLKRLSIRGQPKAASTINGEVEDAAFGYALAEAVNAKPRLVTAETLKSTPNGKGKVDVEFRILAAKKPDPKKGVSAPKPDAPEKEEQ